MSSSISVLHQGRTYYVFDGYITVHYSRKDRGRIIRVARCIPRGPFYDTIKEKANEQMAQAEDHVLPPA